MSSLSVPTKCILFGEHLALHGFEALAIPLLDHRLVLEGRFSPGPLEVRVPAGFQEDHVRELLEFFGIREGIFEFKADLPFPPGVGAGISAAWAVALLRWIQDFLGEKDEARALEAVDWMEEQAHGRASGLDARTIFYERPVALRKGVFEVLDSDLLELPLLKHCKFRVLGIPKESTREMVDLVGQSPAWEKILKIDLPGVDEALEILRGNRSEDWKKLLNTYGEILEDLGAVSESTMALCQKLRVEGAGVKVCGAGGRSEGSGFLMMYAGEKNSNSAVSQALKLKLEAEGREDSFHIGLIADGNRRWAKEKGLDKSEGHRAGVEQIIRVLVPLVSKIPEIGQLSIYLLSCSNLKSRSAEELANIFRIIEEKFSHLIALANQYHLRYIHAGEKEGLPLSFQNTLLRLELETQDHSGLVVNLCINYDSSLEQGRAVKLLLESRGLEPLLDMNASDIAQAIVENQWLTAVDAVIRTGGDSRLSGFLGNRACDVNCALLVVDAYLPDLSEDLFLLQLLRFSQSERRMGK